MKRLLIMLTMLATLLSSGLSQAAPFVFGSDFDDARTLAENLEAMFGADDFNSAFTRISAGDIIADTKYTFTAIGYSAKSVEAGLNITIGNDVVFSANKPFAPGNEFSADELMFRFTDYITSSSYNAFLSDLLPNGDYINSAYQLTADLVVNGTAYVTGTIFISFTIPDWEGYKNENDFILALAPSAAVPVPAAVWLFGSGVAGLVILRRKLR